MEAVKVSRQMSDCDDEIIERLDRIETMLDGLPKLERLVWGFGSALLIAVVGPRFF